MSGEWIVYLSVFIAFFVLAIGSLNCIIMLLFCDLDPKDEKQKKTDAKENIKDKID